MSEKGKKKYIKDNYHRLKKERDRLGKQISDAYDRNDQAEMNYDYNPSDKNYEKWVKATKNLESVSDRVWKSKLDDHIKYSDMAGYTTKGKKVVEKLKSLGIAAAVIGGTAAVGAAYLGIEKAIEKGAAAAKRFVN